MSSGNTTSTKSVSIKASSLTMTNRSSRCHFAMEWWVYLPNKHETIGEHTWRKWPWQETYPHIVNISLSRSINKFTRLSQRSDRVNLNRLKLKSSLDSRLFTQLSSSLPNFFGAKPSVVYIKNHFYFPRLKMLLHKRH